jgi:hypothetical protein
MGEDLLKNASILRIRYLPRDRSLPRKTDSHPRRGIHVLPVYPVVLLNEPPYSNLISDLSRATISGFSYLKE